MNQFFISDSLEVRHLVESINYKLEFQCSNETGSSVSENMCVMDFSDT